MVHVKIDHLTLGDLDWRRIEIHSDLTGKVGPKLAWTLGAACEFFFFFIPRRVYSCLPPTVPSTAFGFHIISALLRCCRWHNHTSLLSIFQRIYTTGNHNYDDLQDGVFHLEDRHGTSSPEDLRVFELLRRGTWSPLRIIRTDTPRSRMLWFAVQGMQ